MSNFWTNFLAGLASGVVLTILTTVFSKMLRRRAKGEPVKLDTRTLRSLIVLLIGLVLVLLDTFVVEQSSRGFLRGIGAFLIGVSVASFL